MGKYWAIFRLALIQSLKNYKGLIGLSIFLVTCLLVFAHLWKVAAVRMGADPIDPDALLWYIALNEWVLIVIPEIQLDIERDCRSGRLAYMLPRPVSYLTSTLFEGLGALCANFLFLGAVTFLFTWWRVNTFPFDAASFTLLILLSAGSAIVSLLFRIAVGLSAFWIQEVGPFDWLWEKMLFALGGLILPLAAYPIWIQKIAAYTPFPAILGERSALALDFSHAAVLHVAGSILLWGCIGLIFVTLLYRRGLKILNVEGG
ncbi:MAG: ABC-2 family transporter protein [Verrucomicrobia bacterium]|nr:ABC-2 family transporter protein [Verrucomicrobiota bacterium]